MLCIAFWEADASDKLPIEAMYERFGSGNEPGDNLIVALKFKVSATGKVFAYHAKGDPGNAEASMGVLFFEPVFSPTGDWTFLPTGEFDGFFFFPTGKWKEALIDGTFGKRFYAFSKNGPALAHRFVKWLGPDEVRLSIGTGEDMSDVDINLRTCETKISKGNLSAKWLYFEKVRTKPK